MKLRRLAPSLLAAALCASAAAAEPTAPGRLFMTPEWRAALERQRQSNVRTTRSLEGESVRLDGIVVRSSGKSTVWINSRPLAERANGSGVSVSASPRRPDRATVAGEIRVRRTAPRD